MANRFTIDHVDIAEMEGHPEFKLPRYSEIVASNLYSLTEVGIFERANNGYSFTPRAVENLKKHIADKGMLEGIVFYILGHYTDGLEREHLHQLLDIVKVGLIKSGLYGRPRSE